MRQIILAINALLKFKAYTLINVLGLACSLACVLTVARYIHQENTVNQCFPEYKRICLIKTSTSSGENFLGGYRSGLEKDPDVEQFTVIYQISDMPVLFGEQEIAANAFSVDSTFFKIFPYRVIAGSGRIVRSRDVVITRSFWKKKLGGKNAIGATFKNTKGNKFTIIGVVDDPDTKRTTDVATQSDRLSVAVAFIAAESTLLPRYLLNFAIHIFIRIDNTSIIRDGTDTSSGVG